MRLDRRRQGLGFRAWLPFTLCVAVWVGTAPAARPGEAQGPPAAIDPESSCVESECHASLAAPSVPHWDALADECGKCHVTVDGEHEFETEQAPDLCLECHDAVSDEAVVHDPAEEDCADCHDPHGSSTEALLTAADVKELCADCHDDVTEAVESAEVSHDPAEDDCTDCHDPHSGPHPYMLAEENRALCNECHDDIVERAESSVVDHAPAISERECVTCHSPHASENESLLRKPPRALCLDCHDEPVDSDGAKLLDMEAWLASNEHLHEPVREAGCTECHDPHGSEHFRLLVEAFPDTFYTGFEAGRYALCFSCHEESLVTQKRTRSETSFRDGEQNLHALHVNRERKGRTCRACHDAHASRGPFQVRATVPFGSWAMPIQYREQEDGGSCQPGCHEKKSYDRTAE